MKKQLLSAAICCMFALNSSNVMAQSPLVWAKTMGRSSRASATTIDASGNVYTTGGFSGNSDFDPGSGLSNLVYWGGASDMFVQKLDAAGNFVWAKAMNGSFDESGNSIAIDASGNVYTTGFFQGTTDFDPGAGTSTLTSAGQNDIFVSKLDASGNFVWAKKIGGQSKDVGTSIAVDASGNVYTTGSFNLTVDFDPGVGIANMTAAGSELADDIFVQKLDASGNFVWAKKMGGISLDFGNSIAVDASGNVLTTGSFQGTADFDPNAGTSNLSSAGGIYDIFVSKLDASGNFLWAKSMGSTGSDRGNAITIDASGNIFTTGYFEGTTDFDPSAATVNLVSVGGQDIFIQKLDASGNFVWAKAMGGAGTEETGNDIMADANGNVYTTGGFSRTADFDPNTSVFNLTTPLGSGSGHDIFVSKLDALGNFGWAGRMGGTGDDFGNGIAVDASGNVIIAGYFKGTADFDPSVAVFNLTPDEQDGSFVLKLRGTLLSTNKTTFANNATLIVYPNPAQNELNISLSNPSSEKLNFQIINIEGKIMQSTENAFAGKKILNIDTQNLPTGMYMVRVQGDNSSQSKRIVISR